MGAPSQLSRQDIRIESWKKIAAYFSRDERTVKRWEHNRALPVHRLPGTRGGVFAYKNELDAWINGDLALPSSGTDAPLTHAELEHHPSPWGVLSSFVPLKGFFARYRLAAAISLMLLGVSLYMTRKHSPLGVRRPNLVENRFVPSPEVRDLYLTGRYYWDQRTPEGLKRAADLFTRAVTRQPNYANAYAGLAATYDLMPEYGSMPNSEAFPKAIIAAREALNLDDSLPEAHRSLAFAEFFWNWDIPTSMGEYQKAISLDPRDVESHHWYATALLTMGKLNEAEVEIEKARELNPSSQSILADKAFIEICSGDKTGGIQKLEELENSERNLVSVHRFLASAFFETGNYSKFISELEIAGKISGNPREQAVAAAAKRGWLRGGEKPMLENMLQTHKVYFLRGEETGFEVGSIDALLGRKSEATSYLRAAFLAHDYMLMTLSKGDLATSLGGYEPFEELKSEVLKRMSGQTSSVQGFNRG